MNTAAAIATAFPAGTQITAAPITIPALADGEEWGGIACEGGRLHHVIVLPGDNDGAGWEAQMKWAASIGGDLPTPLEQKVLISNVKHLFRPEWYWSNTQHASDESYAWVQLFYDGGQYGTLKGNDYRARAVRRVAI